MTVKQSIRKLLSRLLFIAVLLAVGWYIYINVGALRSTSFELKWSYLLFSFICAAGAQISGLSIWYFLSNSYGLKAGILTTCKAWMFSKLGRYVPGKITTLLVRIEIYDKNPKKNVGMATLIEIISTLSAAMIIIILSMVFSPFDMPEYYKLILLFAFVVFITALHPRFILRAVNATMVFFKKKPVDKYPTYMESLKYVLAYLIPIFFYGFSFFLLINALYSLSFDYFLLVTGIYYGASLVGILALFAPSGIGVREGIMMLMLPSFMPEPTVIVATILIRLVATASEISLAVFFLLIDTLLKKNKSF